MSGEEWPPPADESTPWTRIRLPRSGEIARVRPVTLWGRRVLIDASGDVYCPGCGAFRTTGKLSEVGNGCPVGLMRGRGQVVPYDVDADAAAGRGRSQWRDLLGERW